MHVVKHQAQRLGLPETSLQRGKASPLTPTLFISTVAAMINDGIASQLGGQALRAVPVRICTSQRDWRQQPLPPTLPGGATTTLRHALSQALPDLFAAVASTDQGGDGEAASAAVTERASSDEPRVLVQGVPVPLSTPLGWLFSACAHPDGWLYVLVGLPT